MALTADQIQKLYATRRVKGLYEAKMNFLLTESDEPGVDVKEDWPTEFGEKSATTLYQGFSKAAEKLEVAEQVDVVQRDGTVFILVKARVAVLVPSLNGNSAHPDTDESTDTPNEV